MARSNSYINADGLEVGFGTHTADNELAAASSGNLVKTLSALITLANIEDSASVTVASLSNRAANLPRGTVIKAGTLQVVEAATSGGVATLNIGTFHEDSSSVVADDNNGLDDTIALAGVLDVVGAIVNLDGALVGGVVPAGATSNSAVQIVHSFGTAAFTAGKVLLTLEYVVPSIAGVSINA